MTKSGVILDVRDRIGFGAYADLFRPSGEPLVYKLFISVRHETNVRLGLTDPKDNDRRQQVFESECRAYEIAAREPSLHAHIPGSFRRCEIADVRQAGESVAALYLTDCCYTIEYIDGIAQKLGTVALLPHIAEAERAFHRAGIRHTSDASVFLAEDPQPFKFIDFAVDELPPPSW
jgi:hypothetical protein